MLTHNRLTMMHFQTDVILQLNNDLNYFEIEEHFNYLQTSKTHLHTTYCRPVQIKVLNNVLNYWTKHKRSENDIFNY